MKGPVRGFFCLLHGIWEKGRKTAVWGENSENRRRLERARGRTELPDAGEGLAGELGVPPLAVLPDLEDRLGHGGTPLLLHS